MRPRNPVPVRRGNRRKGKPLMPRIQFLIHGGRGSPEAVRAMELSRELRNEDVHFSFRDGSRVNCARQWNRERKMFRPDMAYVLNTGMPGVFLAMLWKTLHGIPFI